MQCPYCGHAMTRDKAIPLLPKRQRRIYDAVSAAGHSGIKIDNLIKAMFKDQEPAPAAYIMLRVQVHGLNENLKPIKQRVMALRGQGYYLTKLPG